MRTGATVQPTAPVSVTPVTEPAALIVAVAIGRVVQVPPVTETSGAVVYPEPPPFVGIEATVPVAFEIAYAVVPEKLNVTAVTFFVTGSMVAVALGIFVHVPPETVTAGLEIYPEPPFVTVATSEVPLRATVAVAVVPETAPVGSATVSVVFAGQTILVESAGGALTVTVGVPIQVVGISKPSRPLSGQIVASAHCELSLTMSGVITGMVHPVRPPIVTVGGVIYQAPPSITAKYSLFGSSVHRATSTVGARTCSVALVTLSPVSVVLILGVYGVHVPAFGTLTVTFGIEVYPDH